MIGWLVTLFSRRNNASPGSRKFAITGRVQGAVAAKGRKANVVSVPGRDKDRFQIRGDNGDVSS